MTRRLALISSLVVVVVAIGSAVVPSQVHACSLAMPEPDERVALFSASAEAVVVGEVIAEEPEQSPSGEGAFNSTFQIVATLSGEPPADMVLANLGYFGADCSGGPRLREGERFLLYLSTQKAAPMGVNHLPTGEWRVDAVGMAAYLIDEGEALFYPMGNPPDEEPAVAAEVLIREVGDALESDPTEVERAVTFANGGALPPQAAEQESNRVAVWGSVGVGLTAVAILVGWYLRGRSRRRG